mmetsp:Transcript_11863/g.26359  ORF Transcript_11863/g.26359 Transcript_11863/m.26359 type:complete len:289 (+) Transcript_11863:849-1715(+)
MRLQRLVGHGEHGAAGGVCDAASGRQRLYFVQEARLHPCAVQEERRLRRALLTRVGVGVLVAHVGHVLHVRHVWAEHLPVPACVLQLDLAVQVSCQQLRHLGGSRELRHARLSTHQQLVHSGPVRVDEVHVLHGHAAVVQQPQRLLHDRRHPAVRLEAHLVAHEQSAHQLQQGDLQGEVEGRDDDHRSEGPPVPRAELPRVVSRHSEGPGQEAHLVSPEVLQELLRDVHLPLGLHVALGRHPLDQLDEELVHLGLLHHVGCLRRHGSVHAIALRVLVGVVQPGLGTLR